MKRFNKLIYILLLLSFSFTADQLYLSKVVVGRGGDNESEKIELYNPTSQPIDISNYYICNFSDYSSCNPNDDPCEISPPRDFIAGFPDGLIIESNQSLTVSLHDEAMFEDYYDEEINQTVYLNEMNSCSSSGTTIIIVQYQPDMNLLQNTKGSLYLLEWDDNNNIFNEIDFLMWGSSADNENPIRAYSEADPTIGNDSMYVRNDFTSQCDDSNDFCSWDVDTIFKWGCMDRDAKNYSLEAEKSIDCKYSIKHITNNINDFLNTNISLENVTVVDYFDITVYNGPHAITIEDEYNYRLELTVWSDDWSQSKNYLLEPPFGKYKINVSGSIGTYDGKTQLQSTSGSIAVVDTLSTDGIFTASENSKTSIDPEPFVLIPSRGEVLKYSYSFPSNSRSIVSIYDLSGRFVTTLFDKYHESPGTRESEWNGRNHLGQILSPGTYLMQIETIKGGTIETDFSPVVIGVQK